MLRIFNLGAGPDAKNGDASHAPDGAEETGLIDSLSDGVLTTDADDRVTYANPAAAELLGRDRGGLIGQQLLNLFARNSADIVRFGQSAARDGLAQSYDAEVAGRDECTVSVGAAPLQTPNGSRGTVLTLRDVTDTRRAHLELVRSEARYRHLFEDASDAIMTFDSLGRLPASTMAARRSPGIPVMN